MEENNRFLFSLPRWPNARPISIHILEGNPEPAVIIDTPEAYHNYHAGSIKPVVQSAEPQQRIIHESQVECCLGPCQGAIL